MINTYVMPPKGPEQTKENPPLSAVEKAAIKNPDVAELAEYENAKLVLLITLGNVNKNPGQLKSELNEAFDPKFQNALLANTKDLAMVE
ncbi:MAG: hypothetical protein WCG98_02405 [bacterium]